MIKGLYTAYTGMINEQNRLDILTNNLANADTTGFKKEGATAQSFSDVLGYKIKDTSEHNIPKKMGVMNLGVKIGENYTDFSQGSFKSTENTFDLGLSGEGFFAIEFQSKAGDTSTKYTRDGSFTLTEDGYLVTKDGDFLLNTDGNHIKLDPLAETSIDRAGAVYQNGVKVSNIQVTDFTDYNFIEKYGENLYQAVEGATEQPANAKIYSGYLEASNVQVVSEMVEMINVTRAYETNQKMIQTMDDTLSKAVNNLGQLV
ncbi:MAG: flagellar basal-body rod protein FlgF [Lachnospiraceae bacterium]|nr:flagellar basal-body rod protein FlgF [Lachnospiraceae bacterium]